MSQRADASQCGGVVVEFESDNIKAARDKKARNLSGDAKFNSKPELLCLVRLCNVILFFSQGSALIYLKGPKFLIYVSGALSMWVRICFFSFHKLPEPIYN